MTVDWETRDLIAVALSAAFGYLLGTLRPVLSDWITDHRRAASAKGSARARFDLLRCQMPDLIADLSDSLTKSPMVRDYLIVPSKDCVFGCDSHAFICFEPEYSHIAQQSLILATNGYVENIGQGTYRKYRMTEAFVEHLRGV